MVLTLQSAIQADGTVQESRSLIDRDTGQPREVDVVVESAVGPYRLLLCFECTSGVRPADVGWVEKMHAKHSSLPTNKLFLVSQSGFTAQAEHKARHLNHVVCSLTSAGECDWATLVKDCRQVFLQDLRASVIPFVGDAFQGHQLQLDDRVRRAKCGVNVSVSEVIDTLLSHPRVGEAAIKKAASTEGNGTILRIEVAPGLEAFTVDGCRMSIDRLSVAVVFKLSSREICLTPGFMDDHCVAFGGAKTETGWIHVTIIQAQGGPPKASVYEYGKDQIARHRKLIGGSASELEPLTDAVMKIVLNGCD